MGRELVEVHLLAVALWGWIGGASADDWNNVRFSIGLAVEVFHPLIDDRSTGLALSERVIDDCTAAVEHPCAWGTTQPRNQTLRVYRQWRRGSAATVANDSTSEVAKVSCR